MIIYKQLGYVYRLLDKHQKAANCFKKMLQIAWYHNDADAELQAYDYIGAEYYYMSDLTRAKFYNDKVCFGEIEHPDSIVRKVSVQILVTKVERRQAG